MSFTGQVVGSVVGRLPASMIRAMASQYAAGASVEEAMAEVVSLEQRGIASTVSVLGEAASSEWYADKQVGELRSVLTAVDAHGAPLDIHLGVKPTALGIDVSHDLAVRSLTTVAGESEERGCIVEVDLEQIDYVDATLDLVRTVRASHLNVYGVVQAYLHRSSNGVQALTREGIPTRIVKGTYKEPGRVAFQLYESIRENYIALVRSYLESGVWVGIGTHDEFVIVKVLHLIKELGVSTDAYEFQMIMGIQETLRQSLVDAGHPVQVTVHFGTDLHLWSVRRLKENPEIARYALTGLTGRARERRHFTSR